MRKHHSASGRWRPYPRPSLCHGLLYSNWIWNTKDDDDDYLEVSGAEMCARQTPATNRESIRECGDESRIRNVITAGDFWLGRRTRQQLLESLPSSSGWCCTKFLPNELQKTTGIFATAMSTCIPESPSPHDCSRSRWTLVDGVPFKKT